MFNNAYSIWHHSIVSVPVDGEELHPWVSVRYLQEEKRLPPIVHGNFIDFELAEALLNNLPLHSST